MPMSPSLGTTSGPKSRRDAFLPGFLVGVITTLGVLALLATGLTYACGKVAGRGTRRLDQRLASPDRAHEAVLYTSLGGPAGGGWCGHRLALQAASPSEPNLQELDRTGGYTFEASCSSSVHMEWRSSTELHVTYSMPRDGVTVHEEPLDGDGKIRMTYEMVAQ